MLKQSLHRIKNQENVKVLAQSRPSDDTKSVWFITMAAAVFAAAFYFFSSFFAFTGGRALTKS